MPEQHNDPERLLHPLERVNETLVQTSTTQVVGDVAAKVRNLVERYGASSIAYYLGTGSTLAVQWPCLVDKRHVAAEVLIAERLTSVEWGPCVDRLLPVVDPDERVAPRVWSQGAISRPLGSLFGARSGDKGGIANLGVWARDQLSWEWLAVWLTVDRLKTLLPEVQPLRVERHILPNLRALNFVLYEFLGDGVSACLRIDPQGKGLGEYFLAQEVEIPSELFFGQDSLAATEDIRVGANA